MELSALKGGVTKTKRLRMQETVELVELQKGAKFTFLYGQGDKLVLMDDETFEQLELPREMLVSAAQALLHVQWLLSVCDMRECSTTVARGAWQCVASSHLLWSSGCASRLLKRRSGRVGDVCRG